MGTKSHGIGNIAVLLLCCIFAVSVLLVLAFSARVYRNVEADTQEGYSRRVGLSYIAAKIHAADVYGAISVGEFDGASALFLDETVEGIRYRTALYAADGWLCELYVQDGAQVLPEDGEKLLEADALTFSQDGAVIEAALTDAQGQTGRMTICLRSGGAA